MHDSLFLKNKLPQVPVELDWRLLKNITIDVLSQDVKLYFYNSSLDFFQKYSGEHMGKQYVANRNSLDYYPLSRFLNHSFNLDDIIVDTIDLNQGVYFLSISQTSKRLYIRLLEYLLEHYNIRQQYFFDKVNGLNGTTINSLTECYETNCIDVIRLSIYDNKFKIYARTFRYHHFDIPDKIKGFLLKALGCVSAELYRKLDTGGMSYDFSDGRTQLFTQNEAIKSHHYS